MDERPDLVDLARAEVGHTAYRWWMFVIIGPFVLAAIGGLTLADAPAILVKATIVIALTTVVVGVLYLLFRRSMRKR